MNREIKLMAFYPELGMSAPVVIGLKDIRFTFDDCKSYYTLSSLPHGTVFIQFTGLQDKNGKDIYEGDILSKIVTTNLPPVKIVAEFNQGIFKQCRIDRNTTSATPLGYVSPECLEVIGNIHENSDLLGEE